MELLDEIQSLGKRVREYGPNIKSEEATKNTLIMPFIKMLGYDPFNLNEVVPEYSAPVGEYKDARVDYAIMSEGKPIIIIECKTFGDELNSKKCSQLLTYFNGCDARVAVLTDGNRYLFFSDLEEPNKMDSKPYMELVVEKPDTSLIPELKKLTKGKFNLEDAISSASQLKYTREFKRIMAEQLESPHEDFLRFFLKQCYEGVITSNVKERFTPVLKEALALFIKDRVNERLTSAFDDVNREEQPPVEPQVTKQEEVAEDDSEDGIVTTEDEKAAYYIIKSILHNLAKPEDVILNDFKTCCNICYARKSQVFVRLYFNKEPYKVAVLNTGPDGKKNQDAVQIDSVDDIFKFADRIKAAVQEYQN